MSTEHDVLVVRLGDIRKHPSADALDITEVDGRPCVIRRGEWKTGDLAVYVPIDSMVPTSDNRFAFLASKADADGRYRVRATRLRGEFSMGLLVKPDAAWAAGQEVSAELDIALYDPPAPTDPDAETNPGFLASYNIESARRWHDSVLAPGEAVELTEKVEGETGRFCYHKGRVWRASALNFKRAQTDNIWTRIEQRYRFAETLRTVAGAALYGEAFGKVTGMKYGATQDEPGFALFDVLDIASRRWWPRKEVYALAAQLGLPTVPVLYHGPWSPALFEHAEGKTVLGAGAHIREGWVLRTIPERTHPTLGRLILKYHGRGYLLGSKA